MAVYREGFNIVENLLNNSKQIFSDAADYGVLVSKGDEFWNQAKQLVDWYGVEGTRKEQRYGSGVTVEHDIELMDEWAVSDGRKSEREATVKYRVSFVSIDSRYKETKGYNGYITIDQLFRT